MTAAPVPQPNRPLRVLVVTKLFPNSVDPMLAIYNKLQCAALSRLCEVDVRATVPWFPGIRLARRWSNAGRFADLPAEEQMDGLRVRRPRYLYLPKLAGHFSPEIYAASIWPHVRALKGKVDVVLACWAFPDGLAGAILARRLGAAVVVKVHGSDLNVLPTDPRVRKRMSAGLPAVDRLVAVSRPLAEKAVELGVPRDRVALVANGINKDLFRVRDRAETRRKLGVEVTGRRIVYVGLLDDTKGVGDLLDAFARIAPAHPDLRLTLVGDGPARARCEQAVAASKGQILMTGTLDSAGVAEWIGACDVLTLPSWNEGTPNVVLEAFASGRRVVTSNVGGIPDIVKSPEMGEMVPPREPAKLAEALARVATSDYDPQSLTKGAPYGWPESAARLHEVLTAAVEHRRARLGFAVI